VFSSGGTRGKGDLVRDACPMFCLQEGLIAASTGNDTSLN
jgi:hypothetical protein